MCALQLCMLQSVRIEMRRNCMRCTLLRDITGLVVVARRLQSTHRIHQFLRPTHYYLAWRYQRHTWCRRPAIDRRQRSIVGLLGRQWWSVFAAQLAMSSVYSWGTCCSHFTHFDGSRVSIALIHICDSVCLSVRTIKPKRLKLKSPNLAQR